MIPYFHEGLRRWSFPTSLSFLISLLCLPGCDDRNLQEIRIAAQDFRFHPAAFHLKAQDPVRLTIVNEGRTAHEFTSRLFHDPQVRIGAIEHPGGLSPEGVIHLKPGQSAKITVHAALGTYFFRCRIRGHKGMDGMLIFE